MSEERPVLQAQVWGVPGVEAKLDPEKFREAARRALLMQLIGLQAYIVADKLSGQVLGVRTGTLRRSINFDVKDEGPGQVVGRIGSFPGYVNPAGKGYAASYAKLHEFGGVVQIPAHTRRIGYNNESARTRLLTKGGSYRKDVETYGETTVRAHTATYPERSFLRSSISERWRLIFAGIREELNKEVRS